MKKRINIAGTIVLNDYKEFYDSFGIECTSPSDVIEALPTSGEDVVIEINSYGGYVDAGNQIYTELLKYKGNVVVDVIMAGSAASIIAMAGDTVRMLPVGQIMIHNVSSATSGDYRDMDKMSEILQTSNSALANAYVQKTNLSKNEVLELMDVETWLDADDAVTYGFADEVLAVNEENTVLVASHAPIIPEEVIRKLQNKNEAISPAVNVNVDTEKIVSGLFSKLEQKLGIFASDDKKENTMLNKFANLINKGDR